MEILALVVLAADLLLLVDVRQEVAYMLELRAFGSHAGSRWLGAETFVPRVADVQRPRGGATLERLLGRLLGRLGLADSSLSISLLLRTSSSRSSVSISSGPEIQ